MWSYTHSQIILTCHRFWSFNRWDSSSETPLGLDVKQSPDVPDAFRPIPGLIPCAEVTGSVGITRHARATQMAGLKDN